MPIEIINPDAEGRLSPILFVTRRQLRDSHRAMSHAIPILDARTDQRLGDSKRCKREIAKRDALRSAIRVLSFDERRDSR